MGSSNRTMRMPLPALCTVVLLGLVQVASGQGPVLTIFPSALTFAAQPVRTLSSPQNITLTNSGAVPVTINGMVLTGTFYGDFAFVSPNPCLTTLPPAASCNFGISFTPGGTSTRTASLLVTGSFGDPQVVPLTGSGIGSCTNIGDCAFQLINQRAAASQNGFFVYQDGDSAFNHGYPSGLFGTIDLGTVQINSSCVDDPSSQTGCSSNSSALDCTRGTVLSFTYPFLTGDDYVGLNFLDPENYDGTNVVGNGYDLTPATTVQFDARSPGPNSAVVQFGVGGCVSNFYPLPSSWTTIRIPIDTLSSPQGLANSCPPALTQTNILFSISTNATMSPLGGIVLLDNIQFTPVPTRQIVNGAGQAADPEALSLPLGDQCCGVVPVIITQPNQSIPPDQVNRNVAAIYESATTLLSLLKRGQPGDVTNALEIANALDYALHHENHGDPLPVAPNGSVALHNAYEGGDIALLNALPGAGGAQAGDSRLAGFSSGSTSCTGFCLVLDGATGGNNAWAILALAAAYLQSGNITYLNDAETIGDWIVGLLTDKSRVSFGGYFVGFPDAGVQPKTLILGKSTENNADIFAAFSLLAQIETTRGNGSAAEQWTAEANVAGDFVMQMYDTTNGRFNTGTVSANPPSPPDPAGGNCQTPFVQKGNDILNTCDFLDSDSFTTLAMAGALRYQNLGWSAPLSYALNLPAPLSFSQSVMAQGLTFQGLDIVPAPPSTGITWEFTGQTADTCEYLYAIFAVSAFQNCFQTYSHQILQAQNQAPFGDGLGLPSSTLQNGDTLQPLDQCLSSPFQCFPERVGLAATNWAIYTDQGFNPLAYASVGLSPAALTFPAQPIGVASSPMTVTLTSAATAPVTITGITATGPDTSDFSEQDTCPRSIPLTSGATCTIAVTFTPAGSGLRTAALAVSDNALGSPQMIALGGQGGPPPPPQSLSISICDAPTTLPENLPLGVYSPALCFQYTGLQAQMYTLSIWLLETQTGNYYCASTQWCQATFPIDNTSGNNSAGQLVEVVDMDVDAYNGFLWVARLDWPNYVASAQQSATAISNRPPILNPIVSPTVQAGQNLEFVVSASDPNGYPLSFQAQGVPLTQGLPTGASFDTTTGQFSWPSPVAGTYQILFTTSESTASPLTDSQLVTIAIVAPTTPSIERVVNAASYTPSVAPGSIASAFGDFLLSAPASATQLPLPDDISGLSFQFGEGAEVPLYFVSGAQVNFQVPWELPAPSQPTLAATLNSAMGTAQAVNLAAFAPAIFSTNATGSGQGAILDASYRLVDSSNPATAGSSVVLIYCTGLGAVTHQPATGSPSPSDPLARTMATPTVTIGGLAANVQFSGLAPGYVGLYQINAQVPAGSATGPAVPVVISIGGVESNTVTLAVQ